MNFDSLGHFIILGSSMAGKSYYTRHLVRILPSVKTFVFTMSPHEWSEVIINPDGTSRPAYTVYTDEFEERATKIVEECKAAVDAERNASIATGKIYEPHGMFNIILDDFNEQSGINTRTDETYKSLFTRSRHAGIRVINTAHQVRAVGPTSRSNSRYVIFMASANDHDIQELAAIFYNGNHTALKSLAKEGMKKNQYTAIVVDIRKRITAFDLAKAPPDNYKRVVFNPDGSYELPNPNATTQIDALVPLGGPNTTAATGQMPSYTGLQPAVAQQISVGAKSANQLYDNSKNNFQINSKIRAEQMVEVNQAQVDIKIANIQNNYKIELRQGIMDVYDILSKPFRTPAETQKIVHTMQKALRCSPPLTVYDYESAIPVFMKTYFPEHQYRSEGREQTEMTDKVCALIASQGDYTFTALETMKLAKMFFK